MQNHDTKGFKVGDRIRIVEMVAEPQYKEKSGTITHIDDIGQLHGTWGGLAVQADQDKIERV